MKAVVAALLFGILTLICIAPAIAQDAGTTADAGAAGIEAGLAKIDAAGEAAKAETPGAPGDKQPPGDIDGGLKEVRTLWGAIKDKAWWLATAAGIFLVMLILQLAGLFKRMGKRWTWIVAGVLSFAAALALSFDEKGFSWATFTGFATAGPTVAWLRGFIKKAVMNKCDKKEEG
jgi:hypothetical protein